MGPANTRSKAAPRPHKQAMQNLRTLVNPQRNPVD
jgi:hypothetical protein